MIEELKNDFIIIQSIKVLEYYSDNSGKGLKGISHIGIANETLGFIISKNLTNKYNNLLCDIMELGYIGKKLGISDWFISPYIRYFIHLEGETIKIINEELLDIINQISRNKMIDDVKNKIFEIKQQRKIVFLQNRLNWERWENESEGLISYRRRLAIHICNEGVYILNDNILTDSEKADKRYPEMVK